MQTERSPYYPFTRFEHAVYRAAFATLEAQFPALKRVLCGRLPEDIHFDDAGELPALVVKIDGEVHRLPIY